MMMMMMNNKVTFTPQILCIVDRESLYILVNKTNLVHSFFLVCLYFSISTCFGQLWDHHQEKQLCLCDTWYFLFCVDDWHAGAYVYIFQFLHVSGDYGPIIRRNNCVYATLGTCYSVWMTGMQEHMLLHTSHPHRITSTKCRTNTVVSPDDGPIVARNM